MSRIKNLKETLISKGFATLKNISFDYLNSQGNWERITREIYDRGDGASALLYNVQKKTVLLTKQFRMPSYLNDTPDGMLIESCAGMQDENDPKQTIIREIEEELGYKVPVLEKVMDVYMTPGGSTEIIHLYLGVYDDSMKVNAGGGLDSEHEDIEVLEYAFAKAIEDVKTGVIRDAKTVILLQQLQLKGVMQ